ncbi:hypothetical protein CBR_g20400 [Chara braunii]|uniref:Uncharacterized protein n=1 Tax=Chara braunii TaxID=69332 RepID=A0A388JU92_CHABU|nr:hypothetical protein CBR_g20400 [Chara braunii]|eukprot:GBG61368.1 hypothetical protein CBR_g20400 [Chara braunii]
MRIYIHYEGVPDHTQVWKGKAEKPTDVHTVVSDLIKEFVIVYNKKHGTIRRLDETRVDLVDHRRRKLLGSALVSKVLQDRADVYVVERSPSPEKLVAEGKEVVHPRDGSSTSLTKHVPEQLSQNVTLRPPAPDDSQSPGGNREAAAGMLLVHRSPEGEARNAKGKACGDGGSNAAAGCPAVDTERVEQILMAPVVKDLLTKALEMEKAGNFKYAIQVFEQLLVVLPTQRTCLRGLASMALAISNYKRAAEFLEIAVDAYPGDERFQARLGDAYYHLGEFRKALQHHDAASRTMTNGGGAVEQEGILESIERSIHESQSNSVKRQANEDDDRFFSVGGNRTTSSLSQKANSVPGKASTTLVTDIRDPYAGDLQGPVTLEDLKLALARALYRLGLEGYANHIIMGILKENGEHQGALFEYGVIALDKGMYQDALRVFLRLLVINQSDKRVKEKAAEVLQKPGTIEYLYQELANVKESPAVLAFLASTIKEFGAVKEAIILYRKAHDSEPANASYILNLVHTLEVRNHYCEALYRAGIYCKRYMDMQLGPSLRLHDVWQTLQGLLVSIAQRDCQDTLDDLTVENLPESGGWLLRFHDLAPSTTARHGDEAEGGSGKRGTESESSEDDGIAAMVCSKLQSECNHNEECEVVHSAAPTAVCPPRSQQAVTEGVVEKGAGLEKSPRECSDVIKCMEIHGQENLGEEMEKRQHDEFPCVSLSLSRKDGSSESRHHIDTKVDGPVHVEGSGPNPAVSTKDCVKDSVEYLANELDALALVFAIVKIMQEYPIPLPLPSVSECPPLFLAGDSHCLSAAWNTVVLRGEKRMLTPLLVTGLKVWHLRDESKFFPKLNFHKVMDGIPDGSQVIMVFGEIDCREGLLISVDKGRYKDVAEGAAVSVGIYIKVLLKLINERKFEVFVHPVPPVLNETRPVVHIFTKTLQMEVLAAGRTEAASGRLHWLDFFDDFLDSEGNLRDSFKLDGTHLSPRYAELLRRELLRF